MIGGGFLGGGISIVPAGKAIIYASMATEDGNNIPNAVFNAVRTGSTVTANGGVDGRAELLVDAGHTYTVSVTPAGGSYLNNSQTVATASAKSYAVKFYLYPAKANEASTTASLNALNTSISTHVGKKDNPHAVTKAQVGLGSYPASPADIGISTATQNALDGTVKTTGDQDIAGIKNFLDYIHVGRDKGGASEVWIHNPDVGTTYEDIVGGANGLMGGFIGWSSSRATHLLNYFVSSAHSSIRLLVRRPSNSGEKQVSWQMYANSDGEGWVIQPMRSSPGSSDAVHTKYVLDRVDEMVDYIDGEVGTHEARKDNPHAVTKAQVGLSNVDNTSDANKPISTATQTALNGKADASSVPSLASFGWTHGSGTLTTNAGTCGYNSAYFVIGDVVTMRFTVGPSEHTRFEVPLPVGVHSANAQCIGISDNANFWVDYNGGTTNTISVNRAQTTVANRSFLMLVIGQPSN